MSNILRAQCDIRFASYVEVLTFSLQIFIVSVPVNIELRIRFSVGNMGLIPKQVIPMIWSKNRL